MNDPTHDLAVALFSELIAVDQLVRHSVAKALPKGMELSHFSVLNHLARSGSERSPAQLAHSFHLTRGAMTNTLNKLEWAGFVHIRPDWDDARRKMVSISPSGLAAREAGVGAITPIIAAVVEKVGPERARATLPILREMRVQLTAPE